MKRQLSQRFLSVFLAVVMVVGILPSTVFAVGTADVPQIMGNAEVLNTNNSPNITVNFTLRRYTADGTPETSANYSDWIQNVTCSMPNSATAYDLFQKIMSDYNLTYESSGSYVYAVTGSNSQVLSASGNSAWMYGLNHKVPPVAMDEIKLQDGDSMMFFYVDDYNIIYASSDSDVLNVRQLISAIGDVTLDSRDAIESARKAYDLLTDLQKIIVNAEMDTNMTVVALEEAESIYARLLSDNPADDREAADTVQQLIDSIGTVTLDSRNAVKAAREAYDALTDEQKALVTNIANLIHAEQTLEALLAAKLEYINQIYETTGDYLLRNAVTGVPVLGGEWMVLGLARAGRISEEIRNKYYANVLQVLSEADSEQLHRSRSTENSRVAIALTSLGYNAADIDGKNLLSPLADLEYVNHQGINGSIWALIAFNTVDYTIPTVINGGTQTTRDALIEKILAAQTAQGGWTLGLGDVDIDTTAMAIQALAPYYRIDTAVQTAIDQALSVLSELQSSDGSFISLGEVSCEGSAQVVTALTSLGIDPDTDARFIKNGTSVLDALLSYYVNGGGFRHTAVGEISAISTEQAYYALVSYYRLLGNQTSLYDMSDMHNESTSPQTADYTRHYATIIFFIASIVTAVIVLRKKNISK